VAVLIAMKVPNRHETNDGEYNGDSVVRSTYRFQAMEVVPLMNVQDA